MRSRGRALLALCGLAVALSSGCGGDGGGGNELSGNVAIDGSATAFPFARQAAADFQKANPGVHVTAGQSGADQGFEEFCAGEIQIAAAAREMTPAEATACSQRGIVTAPLEVAADGIAVVANPKLGLRCLSREQLGRLWRKGSQVKSLAELGHDAETGKKLPAAEISLYGPEDDSDTLASFSQKITGSPAGTRGDYVSGSDDTVAGLIADDDGGVGYVDFASYTEHTDELQLIGVDGGQGCLAPSVETIQDGTYFLARPLLIYPSQAEVAKSAALARFLSFVADQNEAIADSSETVAMTPAAAAKTRAQVRSLTQK